MKRHHKLNSNQQQQQPLQAAENQSQSPAPLEFKTPEELLRFDAAATPVPESIARRLQASLDHAPPGGSSPSWWRRLFKGFNP
jgi:hypothetical protein